MRSKRPSSNSKVGTLLRDPKTLMVLLLGVGLAVVMGVGLLRSGDSASGDAGNPSEESPSAADPALESMDAKLARIRKESLALRDRSADRAREVAIERGQEARTRLLVEAPGVVDREFEAVIWQRLQERVSRPWGGSRPQILGDEVTQAILLLEEAIILDPEHREWPELLAGIYLGMGHDLRAQALLGRLADGRPPVRLLISLLHGELGEESQSRQEAARAARDLGAAEVIGPADPAWLRALAAGLAGHDQVALEQINAARATLPVTAVPRYDQLEAFVRARQFRGAMDMEPRRAEEALDALERLLAVAPEDQRAYEFLTGLGAAEAHRPRVKRILDTLCMSEQARAEAFLVRGNLAALDGALRDAIGYFEEAVRRDPQLHLARNNLAWCLSEVDPPELERAHQLSLEAIEGMTTVDGRANPNALETRGQILIKMGRWQDGVTVLERALPRVAPGQQAKIHAALARAYEELGEPAMANEHRTLASKKAPRTPQGP